MPSYVYVLESGDGHCKIGKSDEPEARAKSIASSTGLIATRISYFLCKGDAIKAEKEAHREMSEFSIFGEWFRIDFLLACKAVEKIAKSGVAENEESMNRKKQRAAYFTDTEWERIVKAGRKSGARSTTQYVSDTMLKASDKELKK